MRTLLVLGYPGMCPKSSGRNVYLRKLSPNMRFETACTNITFYRNISQIHLKSALCSASSHRTTFEKMRCKTEQP